MNLQAVRSAPAPDVLDFPDDLEWVNAREPCSLAALRGRVVLVWFWSYDCVNCLNMLSGLRQLENKYRDGLALLGVHTPKYPMQHPSEIVLKAANRNYVRHPVANDAHWRAWQQYGVDAWPTVLLIDCEGRAVGRFVGEGALRRIDDTIGALLEDAASRDVRVPSKAPASFRTEPRMALRFPAHALATADKLYVSDTGHNRILECTHQGRVLRQFGSGNPGYWDGHAAEAGFNGPQGLAVAGDSLYVADTGNHCVRRIRLLAGEVDTLLGSGACGYETPVNLDDKPVSVSAPTAVAVAGDRIYAALAGQHQIWRVDLHTRKLDRLAGNGRCGVRDGAALKARLAQPSALAGMPGALLIADAAGNAIRQLRLSDFSLVKLSGGAPYDFGNSEGPGAQARFAHPSGLAVDDMTAYVADTFNNRICTVNVHTGDTSTLPLQWRLHEPQGLSFAAESLWIADRNAHEVLRVNVARGEVERIPVGE
ncbi:MAG TPA: thioredoxin-like domain-containing protein [Rhodanobacteraceae bacterium]